MKEKSKKKFRVIFRLTEDEYELLNKIYIAETHSSITFSEFCRKKILQTEKFEKNFFTKDDLDTLFRMQQEIKKMKIEINLSHQFLKKNLSDFSVDEFNNSLISCNQKLEKFLKELEKFDYGHNEVDEYEGE